MAKPRKRERLEEPAPSPTPTPPPPNYGARVTTAKECATCGHPYIRPCVNQKMIDACPNAQFLAKQKGKGRGATTKA